MIEFPLKFNNGRQYIQIRVWSSPRKFYNKFGDCIGIYFRYRDRKPRVGKFGEINLVQAHTDHELVAHELLHFLIDLVRERNGEITKRNEERIVSEYGNLIKRFWRIYDKRIGN